MNEPNHHGASDSETPGTSSPLAGLQTLDLGALGITMTTDEVFACDIDDPDCEVPQVVTVTVEERTSSRQS